MSARILIIDDDAKLIELLSDYLAGNGFEVSSLPDGLNAAEKIGQLSCDLIILDYMLPGKDGLEVLREIRVGHDLPVIMLTAKGDETDRIVGLELGADDYLPKPFNPRELLARIKAVLRRQPHKEPLKRDGQETVSGHLIKAGALVLNTAAFTIEADGRTMDLSTTEFKILKALMKHPSQVLSRDQIMTMAQGRDFMAFDRSVDIHISKLRAKIEKDPASPKRIKTVWGTGYMFAGDQ